MATIRKRKTGAGETHYHVQIRKKGYPSQTASFKRKIDAERWARQTEAAIEEGRHFKTAEAKKHTFSDMVERYIKDELPRKSPTARKIQTAQLNWWGEQLGSYTLADITPALIVECRNRLLSGTTKRHTQRSPATVVRYMAALSHAFTVAVNEWGWLEDSPIRKVKKPKEPRGRNRFLSDDALELGSQIKGERSRLLAACKASANPYLYIVVVLALSTGMRQGEVMNLTWGDVDLPKKRITLTETKNGEIRVVPLVDHALELLSEHSKVRRIDTDLLFPGRKPNRPIDLRKPWLSALKEAGITDFRFHDLRHSAASYLAMNGATLTEISAILGHKTLQMVKRYSHLSEQHTENVVSSMNKKIFSDA